MIYFLDNSLQLQKIVTSKNVTSAIHEHELNGLIRADVELDLSYANKFLVLGIDHVGYYYKDEFYLHKIQRVEYDHVNESVKVVLRHIFFEDMIFGKLIQDVRPQNQDALTMSRQTIDANTRWQTIMTDVTGRLSTNFYWQVPYEVIEFMTENYRIEYLPKILFDGKKINGFQLHLANKIGEDKNIRIPYGSRVLDLKYEEDYSEIITKLVVHGKGEEVGDGYGRRINISDVNFSRNGVESPVGSLYLEDETITNTYGNDGQTPREGREVFEDIEDANELAEAGYQHYLQVSRPQMLFTADVADIGDVGIGDSVMIIRREYDVYFNARIHKLSVDLLYPEDAQVELGDYKHFKESKIARKTREKNDRLHKRNQSLIEQAKREFDENFNSAVEQFRSEFEQAKIDIYAEIEADRVNMETLLNTKLADFDAAFKADMEAAYEDAQRNYTAIEGYVNTTVDTNRNQVEQIINTAEQSAKDYAEQQAQAKAEAVRTDLETVTSGHQQMLADLESNVINIDDFLGDSRSVTLDERFQDITANFEERIRRVDSNTFNMLRGSQLNEPDVYRLLTGATLDSSERINFINVMTSSSGWTAPRIRFEQEVRIEAGKKYIFAVEYRTNSVPELDWFRIQRDDGLTDLMSYSDGELLSIQTDGEWNRAITEFTFSQTITGKLEIGTHYASGDGTRESLHIRLPYLTGSENTEWVYHPLDATQNISEVTRRITQLEDGYSELTTRNEFDFETGKLDQYIKSVESTVEGNYQVLQRVEDWQSTNGASIEETIYGFDQKVWLNDVANIGANLIPQSANAWEDGGLLIGNGGNTNLMQNIRLKERIEVQPNTTYTLSSNSTYSSAIDRIDIHQYLYTGGWINRRTIPRNGKVTFTTWGTADSVRITLIAMDGFAIPTSFIEHPDGRVKIKLEVGDTATPMLNALSRIEQLANSVSIQVQELDGDFLSQSDIEVKPGYVQLGSQRLGDSQFASIFRVSPNSIQAITDRMILNGDLYVDGDITALAVSAINASFSDLFAARVRAGTVHADYVEGFSARFASLYTLNANIERLVAQTVFTNAITTKSVDAIVANIGRVRTAFLTANVIESDHIQVGTALVDKMFATSARIDELITKSHFVTNVKAMSIEAVDGQFSSLMTKYLSAYYIDVDYINGKNAWFETQYVKSANISNLTSQSAFIRDIQAIEITSNQLNIQTLQSKLKGVEGGLTIYGPDGRVLINNSMLRASFDVQIRPNHASSEVKFTGINYATSSNEWQTFEHFYTDFKGSKLLISWAVDFSGPSASEYVEVRVRGFGGSSNPIGTSNKRIFTNGSTAYLNHIIDLGVPDYRTVQAYLEFRRSPTGSSTQNTVRVRVLRVSMTD